MKKLDCSELKNVKGGSCGYYDFGGCPLGYYGPGGCCSHCSYTPSSSSGSTYSGGGGGGTYIPPYVPPGV